MDISELTQFDMEAILGPDSEPFETFTSNLCVPEVKSTADMMKLKDPDAFVRKIVNFLSSFHVDDIYSLENCADLLSKLLNYDDLCTWRNLSISTQSSIKSLFLNPIFNFEESQFISEVRRYTISGLAASLLPDNNRPELLPFLYQCLTDSASNNYLNGLAFDIFADLAWEIGETIVVPSAKTLHSVFRNTLNDDTLDLDVRIAAVSAVIRFIQHMPSSNEKERFQDTQALFSVLSYREMVDVKIHRTILKSQ